MVAVGASEQGAARRAAANFQYGVQAAARVHGEFVAGARRQGDPEPVLVGGGVDVLGHRRRADGENLGGGAVAGDGVAARAGAGVLGLGAGRQHEVGGQAAALGGRIDKQTQRPRPLWRRGLMSTAQVLLGLGLGGVIAEIAFMQRDDGAFPHVNFYVPDPELGVRLEPGASMRFQQQFFDSIFYFSFYFHLPSHK